MLIDLQSLWEKNIRLNQARGTTDNFYLIVGAASLNAYTLSILSGSYSISGTIAGVVAAHRLSADAGVYNITGTDAGLVYQPATGHPLQVDSGVYLLSGTAAVLLAGRYNLAGTGSYTLSGSAVVFRRDYIFSVDSGSYALSGNDVTLRFDNGQAPAIVPLLAMTGCGN